MTTIPDESDHDAKAKERGARLIGFCIGYIHEGVRIQVRQHDEFLKRAEEFQKRVKLLLDE